MTQSATVGPGLPGVEPLFIQHSDIPGRDQLPVRPFDICMAASDSVGRDSILGAQNVRGIWRIYCRSREKRLEMLVKGLSLRGRKVPLFEKNPRATNNSDPNQKVEKITIKDLPLSISNEEVLHYIKQIEGLHLTTDIRYGKERDVKGDLTSFLNGDRYAYAQAPITPIIKPIHTIIGQRCRIFHQSQQQTCQACQQIGHKTLEPCCPAFKPGQDLESVISYTHILSNMHMPQEPIHFQGKQYRSVEHAYQSLKAVSMGQDQLAYKIANARHAGAAKAMSHEIPKPDDRWTQKNLQIMEDLLQARADTDETFCKTLLMTGDKTIVHPVKDMLWGTGLTAGLTNQTDQHYWPGKNLFGQMLMDLRTTLKITAQDLTQQSATGATQDHDSDPASVNNTESTRKSLTQDPQISSKTVPATRGRPTCRVHRKDNSSPSPSKDKLSNIRKSSRASSLPSTPNVEGIELFFKRKPSGTPPDKNHHAKLYKPDNVDGGDDHG